jgi:hypothetical protein
MSGFDNGTIQSGIASQVKRFGAILRGMGPPVPQAGVLGDLYIDVQTWQLFNKRALDSVDPWGNYLFVVPVEYRTKLKWFAPTLPAASLGIEGDYCLLWAGFANYGMRASVYGPKQPTGWPENGEGGIIEIAPPGNEVLQIGLTDPEGPELLKSNSTQLIATGLTDEYILPMPTNTATGDPVQNIGLQSGPLQVDLTLNPLFGAVNQHEVV